MIHIHGKFYRFFMANKDLKGAVLRIGALIRLHLAQLAFRH
jgi:hypothetical protein